MELSLPMNYIELNQDEMMYLDGGWSWRGTLLYAGITLVSIGVIVALSYGNVWLAVKLVGFASKYAKTITVAEALKVTIAATGVGVGLASWLVNKLRI